MQYYASGLCDHNHVIAWEGVFVFMDHEVASLYCAVPQPSVMQI